MSEIITFKSDPKFFWREESGIKCNTVRQCDFSDERFCILDKGEAGYINVKETETPREFTRKISDVVFWNGLCIISWYDIPRKTANNGSDKK